MQERDLIAFDEILDSLKKISEFNEYQDRMLKELNKIHIETPPNTAFNEYSKLIASIEVKSYRPIVSHRRIIGKLFIIVKKIIRKSLEWYIEPICRDITNFNVKSTEFMKYINDKQELIIEEIDKLKIIMQNNIVQQQSQFQNFENLYKDTFEKYLDIELEVDEIKSKVNGYNSQQLMDSQQNLTQKISEQELHLKLLHQELLLRAGEINSIREKIK
ncbi:hypothetical protein [Paenibacillus sp.]|uniref:hypothetical protein n=1 Tax=Paenibacillus sp. TaxID=58172 RepID=UPI0028B14E17|nr:hypothetical protein [Paenibacillus sp.]